MIIITSPNELQQRTTQYLLSGKSIGIVPTMGFLHEGHVSLIEQARKECDIVVVTIFVNKLQFAPHEDFERYPRDIDRDTTLAATAGADILFTPTTEEMYPEGFATAIHIGGVTELFEGVFRKGHFSGVATVVAKLLLLSRATHAYFGQKDYQQCMLIRRLIADVHIPVQMIIAPTVREADGLALSSRNVYLSPEERVKALSLWRGISAVKQAVEQGERHSEILDTILQQEIYRFAPEAIIDYAEVVDSSTLLKKQKWEKGDSIVILIALKIGKTRLIDNFVLHL